MRFSVIARVAAVACMSMAASTAQAQVVKNGSFEQPDILNSGMTLTGAGYVYLGGSSYSFWNYVGGAGLVNTTYGSTAFNVRTPVPDGKQVAFLQSFGSSVYQDVSGLSTGLYELSFYSGGRQNNYLYDGNTSYEVRFGGVTVYTGSTASGDEWKQFQFNVPSTGDAKLEFVNMSEPGDHTFFLDDVSMTQVTSTPEPASLALMGTGLLGIAGVVRRRKKKLEA